MMGGGIMSSARQSASARDSQFVGIEQHLNAEVPGDLEFRDELGSTVKLADYFGHGRPVILNLGYYQCPMLCSELLQGLVGSMKALTFNLGKDFDVVTVSFDPRETTEMAAAKKRDIMKRYGRAKCRARMALPYRQRRPDQRSYQVGRLPISVRSENRTIRPRRRDRHAHARPPHFGIFLRSRVFAQGFAPGIGAGLAKSDWKHRRPGAALLLSLRSAGLENTAPSSAIF